MGSILPAGCRQFHLRWAQHVAWIAWTCWVQWLGPCAVNHRQSKPLPQIAHVVLQFAHSGTQASQRRSTPSKKAQAGGLSLGQCSQSQQQLASDMMTAKLRCWPPAGRCQPFETEYAWRVVQGKCVFWDICQWKTWMLTGVLRQAWAPRMPKRTWEHVGVQVMQQQILRSVSAFAFQQVSWHHGQHCAEAAAPQARRESPGPQFIKGSLLSGLLWCAVNC